MHSLSSAQPHTMKADEEEADDCPDLKNTDDEEESDDKESEDKDEYEGRLRNVITSFHIYSSANNPLTKPHHIVLKLK